MSANSSKPSRLGAWEKIGRGVALLMTLAACGRSSGCSGCSADGPPFPDKDRIQSAIQVRLTDNGVGFLEQNLEPLLAQAIPGGLNVCLPGQGGDVLGLIQYGFCQDQCPDGNQGCPINIAIGGVDLQLVNPATVRATVTFSDLHADINVFANPVVDCNLTIDGPGFPVAVDLNLSTPEPTRDLTFAVANPQYVLSDLDIHLQGNAGFLSPLCDLLDGAINFPVIGDFLLQTLQGFLDGQLPGLINGFLEGFTCMTCQANADCPIEGGATCDGGQCMLNGTCLPAPLGVHGMLDLGALLSSFSPGLAAQLQYLITPGSYVAVENDGLSLGVIGGARSDKARCVPPKPQPPVDVEPPRAVALESNVDPAGRPYEVGIGISDLFVEHGMWAFFNSGALCLGITNDKISQLNTRTLGVLLHDLNRLTRGSEALAITLSPQEVPIATFGGNVTAPDPENPGQYLLQDPLLTIQIPDLWLDFHAFIDDRWVRIFSLNADVEVPLGIAFDPDNGIIPVLGDLSQAIRNVEVDNADIMRDNPQALANLLPVLLGPLLPQLAGGLSNPISLPDVMGYKLDLQDHSIEGIENNTFLGIFANLERAPADGAPNMIRYGLDTTVRVLETHAPAEDELAADSPDFWKRAWVRLAVGGVDGSADEGGLEYQWRVDEGTWSLFTPATEMVVRSPMFALQGKHKVEVRARRISDYHSLDLSPAEVEVNIDSLAPELTLTPVPAASGGQVKVDVSDIVSDREGLTVTWRMGDADAWQTLAADETLVPAPDAADLHVRAVDEAGNVNEQTIASTTQPLIGRSSHDVRTGAAAAGGCGNCGGCVVPGRSTSPGPGALLALLPLGAALRLRRRGQTSRLMAAVVILVAAFLGACGDNTRTKKGTGDAGVTADGGGSLEDAFVRADTGTTPPPGECTVDADCPNGKVCREVASVNTCIALTCENEPSTCESLKCESGRPAICAATGLCECEQPCPDGCPDGQYCCRAEYKCTPLPEACKDMACDPGFEAMVVSEGHANEETCMVDDVQCSCVEKHPLDPGSIGRYSDFALFNGTAYFSAYADSYGDLVVGKFDAGTQQFTWWWVDGVPADGEIVGGPSGPRGGIQAAGDNVGTDTSIAIGPNGQLHVAYRDVTHQSLKYALGRPNGDHFDWTIQTLDAEGDAGRYTSISVDARGVPGIAYRIARHQDGVQWVSLVRYLLAKNDAPGAAADWLPPFTVAQSVLDGACGGLCADGEVCITETQTCAATGNGCPAACADTEACVNGACVAVSAIDPPPMTYPEGTGLFTAQIRDMAGNPVVTWYDRTFGQLWWAKFGDAGFNAPEQLAGYGIPEREGDMGSNVDLTLDGQGNFHFCYQDGGTDSVRYLAPELGRDEWVDDGTRTDDGRQWAVHVVGEDCNIRIDAAGNPVLIYQDSTSQDIVLSRRTAEGEWTRTVIRGNEFEYRGAFGFYTRARVDGAHLWISDYWWNNQDPSHPDGIEVMLEDL